MDILTSDWKTADNRTNTDSQEGLFKIYQKLNSWLNYWHLRITNKNRIYTGCSESNAAFLVPWKLQQIEGTQ